MTPEPAPAAPRARKKAGLEFVVQKHDARRLHYDVRIEIAGAMMSFAVPKGPSFDPKVKRLAVETEDHPMEYNRFEGRIPEGEYGAGDVLVWDRGTYETIPPGEEERMRAKGHLHVRFHGEKLHGDWHFVRTRGGDEDGGKSQWIFFKGREEADPSFDVVTARPESVVSGRVATRGPARASAGVSHNARAVAALAKEVEKATLTKSIEELGEPRDWLFELKYDGYRVLAAKSGDDVVLLSRNGQDWTERFDVVARAVKALPVRECLLDGEVCAVDERGVPSFQKLQRWASGEEEDARLSYAVFDLLSIDGRDVRALPIEQRRELLTPLLASKGSREWTRTGERRARGLGKGSPLVLSGALEASPRESDADEWEAARSMLRAACAAGMEGLIAKRRGSPYREGRTREWLKLKCTLRQEFAVLGYLPFTGTKREVGSLLLGLARGRGGKGGFTYAGKVGTGFDGQTRKAIAKQLDEAHVETPTAEGAPRIRIARWSKPTLVAEVSFTEWTADGVPRHPSFVGLRDDKRPEECVREQPVTPTHAHRSATRAPAETHAAPKLTNEDKVLFPRDGITKRAIADYYAAVADAMLPHLEGRPLALQRWPDGIDGEVWFQQHAPAKVPDFVRVVSIDGRRHLVAENRDTLLWLANLAAFTIHEWASHVPPGTRTDGVSDALAHPDWVVFDLDPGDGPFADVVKVARALHKALDALELESVVKTSGQRGLHVVVPIARVHGFDEAQAFGRAVAQAVARHLPELATIERSLAKRRGKLYVDYLQNGRGKTIVAPYSVRAMDGAPVSTPIAWSEVTEKLDPSKLTIATVPRRLERHGDLFAEALAGTAKLP